MCQSSISVALETISLFSCYLTLIFRIKCCKILFFPLKETLLQVWHTYVSFLGKDRRGGHAEVSVYFESIWPQEGKEEGVAQLYWKTSRMKNLFWHSYFYVVLQVAAEVAAPLAKTDQIVLVGDSGSGVTGEVSKLVSELPPAVQALTGVDLSGVSIISNCTTNSVMVFTCFWKEIL